MASPVDVLAQQMTTSTTLVPRDGQQSLWQNKGDDENSTGHHRSNNNNTDQPQQRRHCGCRRRRSFTISPIDGMEWMQQCHPTYGVDGDVAAKRFLEEKKHLTLSRRFQLIDRGYVLKLKNDNSGDATSEMPRKGCTECGYKGSLFDQLTVRLFTGKMMANAEEAQQQKIEDEANNVCGTEEEMCPK